MDDKTFFDHLLQLWARTTGAQDTYWMPEEDTDHYDGGPGTFIIWSVGQEASKDIDAVNGRKFVGSFNNEADADFITAIHGCLPDLVRRLHAALDEADRLDEERDDLVSIHARLEQENDELRDQLDQLGKDQ